MAEKSEKKSAGSIKHGGHIERGETPLEAAKRELFEETGATGFEICPAFDYKGVDAETSATGQVFFAEVKTLGEIPHGSEIGEARRFDAPPGNWTYPHLQAGLFEWRVEQFMISHMKDAAHDREHVYRVLRYAKLIAAGEPDVDMDLLVTAALLHDIGRVAQFADPSIDHAAYGADLACGWLVSNGYSVDFAENVRRCIRTHRYRTGGEPDCIEGKILFDADKVDVCGMMGMMRTAQYGVHAGEPLYSLLPDGRVADGTNGGEHSLLHEYKFKLEKIYGHFYTKRGAELGEARRKIAADCYNALLAELTECYGGR